MKHKQVRFGMGFKILLGKRQSQAAQMVMSPGDVEGDAGNCHRDCDQWLYVTDGTGHARINGKTYRLRTGSLFLIEHGDRHEIRATGRKPLKTLNIYVPPGYTPSGGELPAANRR
jgi:mannose-6-phosphate isomerase-like protein (cupin superfamily)